MIDEKYFTSKQIIQTDLPEETLFLHVLKQAIYDLQAHKKQEDYDWFFSDDCKQICIWTGVNHKWLIRFINKK